MTGQWFRTRDGHRWFFDSGSLPLDFAYTGAMGGNPAWETLHSPDHLDAAIYSMIDTKPWTAGPAAGRSPGEVVVIDPWEELALTGAGLPI